jgi:hypothetical protein
VNDTVSAKVWTVSDGRSPVDCPHVITVIESPGEESYAVTGTIGPFPDEASALAWLSERLDAPHQPQPPAGSPPVVYEIDALIAPASVQPVTSF